MMRSLIDTDGYPNSLGVNSLCSLNLEQLTVMLQEQDELWLTFFRLIYFMLMVLVVSAIVTGIIFIQ